jgi:hypothetical protein
MKDTNTTSSNLIPIKDVDFFELLNLEHLNNKQRKSYTARITKIAITNSIKQILEENLLPKEKEEQLNQMIQDKVDSIELQEYLASEVPQILEYIHKEVNRLKRAAILKQIDDFITFIRESEIPVEDRSDLQMLRQLIQDIESQDSISTEKLSKYKQIKDKYKFS